MMRYQATAKIERFGRLVARDPVATVGHVEVQVASERLAQRRQPVERRCCVAAAMYVHHPVLVPTQTAQHIQPIQRSSGRSSQFSDRLDETNEPRGT